MKKQLIVISLLLVFSGCTPTPTSIPVQPAPASEIPAALPSVTIVPQDAASTVPVVATATLLVVATQATGKLGLQVLSPQDEAVVSAPQVEVKGLTAAGAVVSVNDEILIADSNGQFRTMIALDEGPNVIEIVASDENEDEASLILTVTYEP